MININPQRPMLIKPYRPPKLAYFIEFEKIGTQHALLFPCNIYGIANLEDMTEATKKLYWKVINEKYNSYKQIQTLSLMQPEILPLFVCSCGSINELTSNDYYCICGAHYNKVSVLSLPQAEKVFTNG